ncbi:MAG: alpha/beta hydrolase [Rhodospirillales bacterium]|nr:alpha/beta hydrolase [Rhodospirillales bacterium]
MPGPGRLDLDDRQLEYRWVPAAHANPNHPVLVFLHEGLGCTASWRHFPIQVVQQTGHSAFVYSRAGYGTSSSVSLPRPLHYMHDEGLDVLPRLLDKLQFESVILIGHSDGASIALIHAGGYRGNAASRVSGIVALAPHVFNEDVSVASIREAACAYRDGDLRDKLKRLHGDNVDCAFWGWNEAWLHPRFLAWNIEEYLPGVSVPVLIIQGLDDQYGTAAQYRAIEAQCGGKVDVLVVDDCGHSPHREQTVITLTAITNFVRRLVDQRRT